MQWFVGGSEECMHGGERAFDQSMVGGGLEVKRASATGEARESYCGAGNVEK